MNKAEKMKSGDIIAAVYGELDRAIAKFPTWPTDPLHALTEAQEREP